MRHSPWAIIFDFDYTLVDSSEGIVECIGYALGRMGLPPVSHEAACRTIGLSLDETLLALAGHESAGRAAEFRRLFAERAEQVMVDRTALFPAARVAIPALQARGYRLAIVSTKFRRRIRATLERDGFAGFFEVIVGGEDVTRPKPDPEGLRYALKTLSLGVSRALYVGDSVADAQAAAAARVPFVGVLSGVTLASELEPYHPQAILADVSELPALLDRGAGSEG